MDGELGGLVLDELFSTTVLARSDLPRVAVGVVGS